MPTDFAGTLVLVFSCALTFVAARLLSRKWRARRRQKEEAQRRANESRQVRRARERRAK
jgi:flagellar biosynthesis/type III secretory pathway M-ring protein FliF/YscJ